MNKIKVRFAPSPTGFLHLGGMRTALFNYLFAQNQGGEFILRIEDTDEQRNVEKAKEAILQAFEWLGMRNDGEIFYQSQRLEIYQEYAQKLLDSGKAYKCYCTKERLDKLREEQTQQNIKPHYDRHCRDLNSDNHSQEYTLRFKTPLEGNVVLKDLVKGNISVNNKELDDLIILRTDQKPTYNFAVVVDDYLMKISHIIRGDDHVNNTVRQIHIFEAFGFELPQFAHLSSILDNDGKKLSKRTGAKNILDYRDLGILPDALINYIARLGWSYQDQEIFSKDELRKLFSLESVSSSSARLDEEKLFWVNTQHLKNKPIEQIISYAQQINLFDEDLQKLNASELTQWLNLYLPKVQYLQQFNSLLTFVQHAPQQYDIQAVEKHINSNSKNLLSILLEQLKALENWQVDSLNTLLKELSKAQSVKFPQLAQPIRIAILGSDNSPSVTDIAFLLGQTETCKRLQNFINTLI